MSRVTVALATGLLPTGCGADDEPAPESSDTTATTPVAVRDNLQAAGYEEVRLFSNPAPRGAGKVAVVGVKLGWPGYSVGRVLFLDDPESALKEATNSEEYTEPRGNRAEAEAVGPVVHYVSTDRAELAADLGSELDALIEAGSG